MQGPSFEDKAKEFYSEWIESDNKIVTIFWVLCIVGVLVMTIVLQSPNVSFIGVADSREQIINFEYPVEIRRVHVMAGQAVQMGDLLAELDQSDLNFRIQQLATQYQTLKAQHNLKVQMSLVGSENPSDALKIDDDSDPLKVEVQSLLREIQFLEKQKKNLYIFADMSGVIGSVNYKRGERAAAFTPLLTISPASPTYVQGFIHESMYTKVKLGQMVHVSSSTDARKRVEGKVVSVGSRIVEFPLRLQRYPNVTLWGREVVVELPSTNPYLLGESVQITPEFSFFETVYADNAAVVPAKVKVQKDNPQVLPIPDNLKALSKFEPSGLIYLEDVKKFVVVSDDTDPQDTPYLYFMNTDGSLDEQPVIIANQNKINDLESITVDTNKNIYAMSSLSRNSKGDDKKSRNWLLKIARDGINFKTLQSVNLRRLLLGAITSSADEKVRSLGPGVMAELEVESMFISSNDLFVGLKAPLADQADSIILKIKNVSDVLSKNILPSTDVEIWRILSFQKANVQLAVRITDMTLVENKLYITTSCHGNANCSQLWTYDSAPQGTSKPQLVKEFPGLTAEGVAYNPVKHELMVVFDEGTSANYTFAILPDSATSAAKE
jgi:hypothetical protein